MEAQIARFISYLFHPMIMPSLGVILVYWSGTYISYTIPLQNWALLLLLVFIYTFIIPLVFTLFLLFTKVIGSLQLRTLQERRYPYLLAVMFYFGAYWLISRYRFPQLIDSMMFGAACSVMAVLLFSLAWKVSAHMIGIGGLTGAIFAIAFVFSVDISNMLYSLIIIAGLIGFARLKLDAHRPAEIYIGFLTGALCEFIPVYYGLG